MSLQAIVRTSTMIVSVWGGDGPKPAKVGVLDRNVSDTAFKKHQGEGATSDADLTLHTDNGLSILFNPPPPQGAPPPWLGTFQLASSLAAGLCLFGPWRDFASCSCRCLSVYEDDSCMSLPGLFC